MTAYLRGLRFPSGDGGARDTLATPWLQDRPGGSAGWAAIPAGPGLVADGGSRVRVGARAAARQRRRRRHGPNRCFCLQTSSHAASAGTRAPRSRPARLHSGQMSPCLDKTGPLSSPTAGLGGKEQSSCNTVVPSHADTKPLQLDAKGPTTRSVNGRGSAIPARREHVSCTTLFGTCPLLIRLIAAKSSNDCRTSAASARRRPGRPHGHGVRAQGQFRLDHGQLARTSISGCKIPHSSRGASRKAIVPLTASLVDPTPETYLITVYCSKPTAARGLT
ncbi:hypothetical protein CC86DRAFT_200170 [Ophiobolus disseminans]|uniref:Uncharacterized protein n=1 Tax=Ophiobolus disseminans TaxID=1469910 RepID=A0A6A7A388_9PLEO|nr:hypothetical protein CC86DRAFT_200170 [Ophiobolus disseminans]